MSYANRNILKIWEEAFPDDFAPRMNPKNQIHFDNNNNDVDFFVYDSHSHHHQQQHTMGAGSRRQRNTNASSSDAKNNNHHQNDPTVTLQQVAPILFPGDGLDGLKNRILLSSSSSKEDSNNNNSSSHSYLNFSFQHEESFVESALATILSGRNLCVSQEYFPISSSSAHFPSNSVEQAIAQRNTCYATLSLACLLHTIHQTPANVMMEKNQSQQQQQQNNSTTTNNKRRPISLVITSRSQNSREITKMMKLIEKENNWKPSSGSNDNNNDASLVKNLNDEEGNNNKDPIQHLFEKETFEILVGTVDKILEYFATSSQPKNNQQSSSSSGYNTFLTSRISYVWIDEADVILSTKGMNTSLVNFLTSSTSAVTKVQTVLSLFAPFRSLFSPVVASTATTISTSENNNTSTTTVNNNNNNNGMLGFLLSQLFRHHQHQQHEEELIFIKPRNPSMTSLSRQKKDSIIIINPQTSLILWNIDYDNCYRPLQQQQTGVEHVLGKFFSDSNTQQQRFRQEFLHLHPDSFSLCEFARYFMGYPSIVDDDASSSSSLSFLHRCRGCILLSFPSEKERNAAFRKLNGKRENEVFVGKRNNNTSGNDILYPMIPPPSTQFMIVRRSEEGGNFIDFRTHHHQHDEEEQRNDNNNHLADFLNQHQQHGTSVILRNIVRSLIDVWPSPSSSRVAKSIEMEILSKMTVNAIPFNTFYWWVTNNLQHCHTLSSDGKSGKDCLENETSSDGTYRFHDEVRLVVQCDSFIRACDFVKLLLLMSDDCSGDGEKKINFVEEGFKLGKDGKRQIIAHFCTSVTSPSSTTTTTTKYQMFQPNQELDPELDADFLALETDDA